MKEKVMRRSLAVLTVGTVTKLTGLTPRKLRYYEYFELIHPKRSTGNQRQYSLNDVDRLLEIKDYLASGMTMHEVVRVLNKKTSTVSLTTSDTETMSDSTARKIFHDEMLQIGRWNNQDSNNSF
ncbi:MerR family transcriptional regulator [Bombilactobacillus folatiphilus]|uniref:MerR family transcriptional regulator n=1 Tax=Bombilactobacillus folatiphilus TaxID=2923362 RepID=A0ABY4PA67_9LACO|nr:MerR family transcriptional regulator [Bombilactobacillus folatiphilus]UQS82568.1 MerR family transcriptional regulator [Bombilactobacillus folatiphilus]